MHWSDLDLWQSSHEFVKNIYKYTSDFPEEEQYGLISQMRRFAIEILKKNASSINNLEIGKVEIKKTTRFYKIQ